VIRYRRLRGGDVKRVRSVALRSWKFTYRKIYLAKTIERRVSRYYSDQSFEPILPRIQKGVEWFYVVSDNKRVIGFSYIGRGRHGWELDRLYLLPEYTGKGIGRKLLQLGEAFLSRRKINRYFVYAHARNRPGIEFYLRNDFKRVPTMDTGGEVCLEKKLPRPSSCR